LRNAAVHSKTDMKQELTGWSQRHLTKLRKQPLQTSGPPPEGPATGNPPRQRAAARRKPMVNAGANKGKPQGKVLKESLQLQKQLRHLTHRIFAAQEDERSKISHELQDEIAQTLLGLNVRLLLLKQTVWSKTKGLKNEIASAQRLVVKSASLVRRLARELDHHRPTWNERTVTTI
jgi:signal transduction histidine kinase